MTDRQASSQAAKRNPERWRESLIERLAFAAIREQRARRRWGIFFKFLMFSYLVALFVAYLPDDWRTAGMGGDKHTAIVEVNGVIADTLQASADRVVTGLRAAFEDKDTAGVILRINSPGGSAVQSGYIYDEVRRLREEYPDVKVYAVITDVGASGAYYLASAADEIYADKASMVGSIGVLMNGFGFVEALDKLGIERRLMTAGENKAFLDPFSPLREADGKHVQALLDTIHAQFIERVREGRGDRLKDDPRLFSGLVWAGEEALELGLVDGLGSTGFVAREVIGVEDTVEFTQRGDLLERLADRFGAVMAGILWSAPGVGAYLPR